MGDSDLFRRTYWNWKGRIGRAHFLFGLIAMMLAWQLAGGVTFFLVLSASLFRSAAIGLAVSAPFLIFLSSLVAQRSHDIGWSAGVPLGVFVVAATAQAFAYFYFAVRGGHFLMAATTGSPFLFIAFAASAVWVFLVLFLAFAPGQQGENRFGLPPKPVA